QQPSFYGGLNIGWDYDHYWGIEKRLGFGALNLTDENHRPIPQTGASVTGEYRLMYYPLGDARWRPFLTAGAGWSDFYFNDDHGARHLDTVGMIPFGLGLKYLCSEHVAIRVDLIDEMTFGTGALSNFHYVALAAGLEIRYGHRLIRMPWHRN
ncbi:MAG TPA: outer membrane beta-barrel protein, partial [Planctomycetaceae bacterium]